MLISTIIEMNNSPEGFNSRSELSKERFSEFELDLSILKKKGKMIEKKINRTSEHIKYTNITI